MSNTHSPGPWRCDYPLTERGQFYIRAGSDNDTVATLDCSEVPALQAEANALLCAAAPDLLAALRNLVYAEDCRHKAGYRPGEAAHVELGNLSTAARAALAKVDSP